MAALPSGGCPVSFTDIVLHHDHPARTSGDLRGGVCACNDPGSHAGYNLRLRVVEAIRPCPIPPVTVSSRLVALRPARPCRRTRKAG